MKTKLSKIDFSTIIYILFGFFILSWVLWYNGYPLVYSDTGTYVVSAEINQIPQDRPKSYSDFIKITGMGTSLFIPIIVQTLFLSFALFSLFKNVCQAKSYRNNFLITCVILAFTTAVSWYSVQLMADIFAPILVLSTLNLLLQKSKGYFQMILSILLVMIAISFHNSHLVMAIQLHFVILFLYFFRKKISLLSEIGDLKRKVLLISAVYLVGFFITPINHYFTNGSFNYAQSSHVILISKFVENGTLKSFLEERCNEDPVFAEQHSFCSCYEEIPNNVSPFLWAADSPLVKTGGWGEGTKDQYNSIMIEMLLTPKYFFENLFSTIKATISQLFRVSIGEGLGAYKEGTPPYYVVHEYYPQEANSYDLAHQNGINFDFDFVNYLHLFVLLISVVFLILVTNVATGVIPKNQQVILVICVLSILINSSATGGLHFPYARFQSRIVWLLPFSVLLIALDNKELLKKLLQGREE